METLYSKINTGPTILSMPQILFYMQQLQNFSIGEVESESILFLKILDILIESFCDSGIFEIDDSNELAVLEFNEWLINLTRSIKNSQPTKILYVYIDTFSARM